MHILLDKALTTLYMGSLDAITPELKIEMSNMAQMYLNKTSFTQEDVENIIKILKISNILYNNTSIEVLPLEDGVYDLLVVLADNLTGGKAPVGAPPIQFKEAEPKAQSEIPINLNTKTEVIKLINKDSMVFFNNLTKNSVIPEDFIITKPKKYSQPSGGRSVPHDYKELVGTLEKCKFVTTQDAVWHGVNPNDETVKIYERDFALQMYQQGIIGDLIATLKMDGVSVECTVRGDEIISARTRGDTANDEATDLTHIFGGFRFPRACIVQKDMEFGIQFECVIRADKLRELAERERISYDNPRTAVIGILSRNNARLFRDYLTLVPIRTGGINEFYNDRQLELEFLNKYYSCGIELRYAVIKGDYTMQLFQVHEFVNNAEALRSAMPFMYDGVVIEFIDPRIKDYLGRSNSINRWAIAIKFPAMRKKSILKNVEYTIGQDGRIVPMAYFSPVEFFGAVHDKTTIHSYKRFKALDLHLHDLVELEYRNDVIVYLSKPMCDENDQNAKSSPRFKFPDVCPYCGTTIMQSDSGDTAYCPNFMCLGRVYKRCTNMLKKLNFQDFGEKYVIKMNIRSFYDLVHYDYNKAVELIGRVMADKFEARRQELMNKPYEDYRLMSAIGFDGIASSKWALILQNIHLDTILNASDVDLYAMIVSVKGLGAEAGKRINEMRGFFRRDIETIIRMPNVVSSFGILESKIIVRFTGIRDQKICDALNLTGKFDASGEKSVTKKTDILVIPHQGFHSAKFDKIGPRCRIMTLDELYRYSGIQSVMYF